MTDFLPHSKVRNQNGVLAPVFRGDWNGDAVKNGHSIIETDHDLGSGGLYFTEDLSVAEGYASGKSFYDEDAWSILKFTKAERAARPGRHTALKSMGSLLTPDELQKLTKAILGVGEDLENSWVTLDAGPNAYISRSTWQDHLLRHRNNPIMAMDDILYQSGLLDNKEYLWFLENCGVFSFVFYDDPYAERPAITPAFLNIENPLCLDALTPDLIERFRDTLGPAANSDPSFAAICELLQGNTSSTTMTIVTKEFRQAATELGFDGVFDPTGGTNSNGDLHNVWICFNSTQVIPAYCAQAGLYRRENAIELGATADAHHADPVPIYC